MTLKTTSSRQSTAPTASPSSGSTLSKSGDWTALDWKIKSPMNLRRVSKSTRRFPDGCSSPMPSHSSLPSLSLSLVSPPSSADGEVCSRPLPQVYVLPPTHLSKSRKQETNPLSRSLPSSQSQHPSPQQPSTAPSWEHSTPPSNPTRSRAPWAKTCTSPHG